MDWLVRLRLYYEVYGQDFSNLPKYEVIRITITLPVELRTSLQDVRVQEFVVFVEQQTERSVKIIRSDIKELIASLGNYYDAFSQRK